MKKILFENNVWHRIVATAIHFTIAIKLYYGSVITGSLFWKFFFSNIIAFSIVGLIAIIFEILQQLGVIKGSGNLKDIVRGFQGSFFGFVIFIIYFITFGILGG